MCVHLLTASKYMKTNEEEMDKCAGAAGDFKPFAVVDTSSAENTK